MTEAHKNETVYCEIFLAPPPELQIYCELSAKQRNFANVSPSECKLKVIYDFYS